MVSALDTQAVWILLFADVFLATLCYMTLVLTILRRGRLRQQEMAVRAHASLQPSIPARFPAPTVTRTSIPERWRVPSGMTTANPLILNIEPDDTFIADHRSARKLVDFLIQETVKKAS